jgi:hypothetical protein
MDETSVIVLSQNLVEPREKICTTVTYCYICVISVIILLLVGLLFYYGYKPMNV